MKIITAPEIIERMEGEKYLFLAGGITNCPNWQEDVIKYLEPLRGDRLIVLNPRREYTFPVHDSSEVYRQIEWEFDALEKADIFSMYFCSGESDQPICMYELGRNIVRMQMKYPSDWQHRIIISVEKGYSRKADVLIQTELATDNKVKVNTVYYDNLREIHAERIISSYLKTR